MVEAKVEAERDSSIGTLGTIATPAEVGLGRQEVHVVDAIVVIVQPVLAGRADEAMPLALAKPGIGLAIS